MQKPVAVLLAAALVLTGCSGWSSARVNPKNWFGKGRAAPAEAPAAAQEVNPLLPPRRSGLFARPEPEDVSVPIARVSALRVEPTTTGAIVYAEGIASRQGPFATSLRPVSTEAQIADGLLVLSFRVVYPARPTPVGPERARTVHEAYPLSRKQLGRIRVVRVEGRENALESRRR